MTSPELGRLLAVLGAVLLIAGLLLSFGKGIPLLGRLPGDFRIQRDGFTVYLPLASSLLVSVVLTLALRLFKR